MMSAPVEHVVVVSDMERLRQRAEVAFAQDNREEYMKNARTLISGRDIACWFLTPDGKPTARVIEAEQKKEQEKRIVSLVLDTLHKCLYELSQRK